MSISKANHQLALDKARFERAMAHAHERMELANAKRKQCSEKISLEFRRVPAPARTSTKGFAAKDPKLALNALSSIDVESDALKVELAELDLIATKYCVRTASNKLCESRDGRVALYSSPKAAAMMAAQTVRYIYDVACELVCSNPEQFSLDGLEWHTPQSVLKGRESRGAGIVAYTDGARALVAAASALAKERVVARVDAARKYDAEMAATASAAE